MARLYTSNSGLPSSQVHEIFQDSRGFIWISSENGLARFDGMDFTTFRFSRDKAEGLASDLVPTVFEDSRGVLWVGTSRGLQTFDPDNSSFHLVDVNGAPETASPYVSDIIEFKTGTGLSEVWVATSSQGVYILDTETHALKDDRRELLSSNLPTVFMSRLFQDSAGRVWLAGETGGLSVVDGATMRRTDITLDEGIMARSFAEDPDNGDILIGTMSGLYIYEAATGRVRPSADPGARSCEAVSLLPNRANQRAGDKTYIVGTESEGLHVYDKAADRFREASLSRIPFDMSRWKIHALTEDNQGNVWVGAFQTGVLVVPRSMYGFDYLSVGPSGMYGQQHACATSIVRNPADGSLWIGTDGGGILRVGKDGSRTFFTEANSGLTNDSVMALTFDKYGTLWAATYLDGLFTYTPATGFRPFAGPRHPLPCFPESGADHQPGPHQVGEHPDD